MSAHRPAAHPAATPPAAHLLPLDDYRAPAMPADGALRTLWWRVKKQFRPSAEADAVRDENRLRATTLQLLDEVAPGPACGPLLQGFDAAVDGWLHEPHGSQHRVLVLPPCDAGDVLGEWAQARGHDVLHGPERSRSGAPPPRPPQRHASAAAGTDFLPQDGDDALLVIPRLEDWFVRQRNGLHAVRALLAELQHTRRRCLIGCNSWAWAFLVRAAGAAVALPSPLAFPAWDARRLRAWFSALAAQAGAQPVVFRLASSGADVLAPRGEDDAPDCEPDCNYLAELAARSHGIAWVAWHLWRKALRTGIDAGDGQPGGAQGGRPAARAASGHGAGAGERTFWIADVPDPALPPHHEDDALLVLHALLIHGGMDQPELLSVLPDGTATETLPALLRAGFVEQHGGRVRLLPSAYPATRRALLADGFPAGVI